MQSQEGLTQFANPSGKPNIKLVFFAGKLWNEKQLRECGFDARHLINSREFLLSTKILHLSVSQETLFWKRASGTSAKRKLLPLISWTEFLDDFPSVARNVSLELIMIMFCFDPEILFKISVHLKGAIFLNNSEASLVWGGRQKGS